MDNDDLQGGGGEDVLLGGHNADVLEGGDGIDQLYGDDGTMATTFGHGDGLLFGDVGNAGDQQGQRLWGGGGIDKLYAYAPTDQIAIERGLVGDQLLGGPGGDILYGNLREDILVGAGGNEFLHGDYLSGPNDALNGDAATAGSDDVLYGGSGEDLLLGGGGNDLIVGNDDVLPDLGRAYLVLRHTDTDPLTPDVVTLSHLTGTSPILFGFTLLGPLIVDALNVGLIHEILRNELDSQGIVLSPEARSRYLTMKNGSSATKMRSTF